MREYTADHKVPARFSKLNGLDPILEHRLCRSLRIPFEGRKDTGIGAPVDAVVGIINQRRPRLYRGRDSIAGVDIVGPCAVAVDNHLVEPRDDEVDGAAGFDLDLIRDKRVDVELIGGRRSEVRETVNAGGPCAETYRRRRQRTAYGGEMIMLTAGFRCRPGSRWCCKRRHGRRSNSRFFEKLSPFHEALSLG